MRKDSLDRDTSSLQWLPVISRKLSLWALAALTWGLARPALAAMNVQGSHLYHRHYESGPHYRMGWYAQPIGPVGAGSSYFFYHVQRWGVRVIPIGGYLAPFSPIEGRARTGYARQPMPYEVEVYSVNPKTLKLPAQD